VPTRLRSFGLRAVIAAGFAIALARPAGAQTAAELDSAVAKLATIKIEAAAPQETYRSMLRGYFFLQNELKGYDRKIVRLEKHLDSLKTVVAPAKEREIARLDSATAQVRARRLALEARLEALEASQRSAGAVVAETSGSPDDKPER
jgi:chromosome segregation ATPase